MPAPPPKLLDDPLLTPKEAARMLGVGVPTLTTWAREGKLPYTLTPGGHRRYQRSVVHTLIEADDDAPSGTQSSNATT